MKFKIGLWALLACVACASVPAAAQDDGAQAVPAWYVGPLVGYAWPDPARDASYGLNGQVVLGAMLDDAVAVELTGFETRLTRASDHSEHDLVYGGGLDLTFGTAAPGNPFFMLGGGVAQQDIDGVRQSDDYGEIGAGLYLPFSIAGELWRLEGRYGVIFNDHPAIAASDTLEDGRVNLGVLFAFGRPDASAESAAAPDADGDGVPDAADHCPDTPRWVRPDAVGCVPDSDGDGVDDSKDQCADTVAGTLVDATGCVPRAVPPAPAPAAAPSTTLLPPPPAPDEDHDGIPDTTDACPHTVPRFDVDEKGCVRPEDVTLRNVHFDVNSSRLTADGYQLLRMVSTAMKADPAMRLEVQGHADATGGKSLNRTLALQRAEVVRDFLGYTGIDEARLTVKTFGASQPVAGNDTAEGRASNRRVQFRRLTN